MGKTCVSTHLRPAESETVSVCGQCASPPRYPPYPVTHTTGKVNTTHILHCSPLWGTLRRPAGRDGEGENQAGGDEVEREGASQAVGDEVERERARQ